MDNIPITVVCIPCRWFACALLFVCRGLRVVAMAARVLCRVLLRHSQAAQAMPACLQALRSDTTVQLGNEIRQISTSSVALNNLLNLLDSEIQHEKTQYEKPPLVADSAPNGFILSQEPGDTLLVLNRKYLDEELTVACSMNLQEPQEPEEGESEVQFNVTVTKGQESLVFECSSDGTDVVIKHISHEPKDGYESETSYTGPVFSELDGSLQDEFHNYLADRGINDELGEYLRFLVFDKEQTEYVGWLERVKNFVRK